MNSIEALTTEHFSNRSQLLLRVGRLLARRIDFLTFAGVVGVMFWRFRLAGRNVFSYESGLDASWNLDLPRKAAQGIWLGRDVAFTYGPLFQAMLRLGKLDNGSLGSSLNTFWFIPFVFFALVLFGALFLLLRSEPAWKRGLAFLLIFGFWVPLYFRLAVPVFVLAISLTLLAKHCLTIRDSVLSATAVAFLVTGAFLLSADCGFYSAAAVLIACLSHALFHGRGGFLVAARTLLYACLVSAGLAMLVNRWAGSWMDFHFWRATYAIVSDYRWLEPFRFSITDRELLRALLGISILVFLIAGIRAVRTRDSRMMTELLAFLLMSVAALETCVVRSQVEEVMIGLMPLVIFVVVLLFDVRVFPASAWGIPVTVLAITFITICIGPTSALRVPPRVEACSSGEVEFSQLCGPSDVMQPLINGVRYLEQRTDSQDWVAAFPWDNIYAIAAGRRVAGGVLQNYLVGGEYLSKLQVAGLSRASTGFYSLDGMHGFNFDIVPDFTRSPMVWFYLQSNFAKDADVARGLLALRRDTSRAERLQMTTSEISKTRMRFKIDGKREMEVLSKPVLADIDFVRIRLRVQYPVWWKLLKPSRSNMIIRYEDGSTKEFEVDIPPNQNYDLWIYPWDERELANYFGRTETVWHSARPHRQVSSMVMSFEPFDHFSIMPQILDVENVSGLELGLR